MRMRNIMKFVATLLLLTTSLSLMAQNITVKGTVMDKDNSPLIGATVTVAGTSTGVIVGADGTYAITADPEAVLEASYLGYLSKKALVGKREVVDFILEEDPKFLEEVVVVGYGTQKKVNMTGSVTMVNFEEIAKSRPIQTAQQALAGASAGVSVNQASESLVMRI